MKIFITGGTGFIGKHLVGKLKEDKNNELFLLSKNLADIGSWQEEVGKFNPEATIHLAWEGIPDYNAEISIKNLKYGLDLMKMLVEIGCKKVIFAGSCWEYGRQSGKISEEMPTMPFNAFTAAKNALHWLAREVAKENNIQFIWTRFFYVYGPGQKETSIIPYLINCAEEGRIPEIKNLYAKNDFVYVGDVVEALSLLVKKCENSGIYNIGSGYSTSVQQIIKTVYKKFNLQPQYKKAEISEKDFVDFWADISKIEKAVNWKPEVHIEEGIYKTINN